MGDTRQRGERGQYEEVSQLVGAPLRFEASISLLEIPPCTPSVRQLDDTHLEWKAEIGGEEHTWKAEISQQEPDRLVSWRSLHGKYNSGKVTFESLAPEKTRVNVEMTYDTEGMKEAIGSSLGIDSMWVSGDLDRFKEFIEKRQTRQAAGAVKSARGRSQTGSLTCSRPASPARP